ncbi:type II secretion system protein GspC [Dethiosulfovibrio salsuginis]|uniref:PDZ domain-containing protein n=1 Tax=Dethiosulfovibrio salsuginis TaxID=561720 RepID=A0A1X7J271_9BACT|nr:type II secretion system protein GspC [Dethiosulfovibrio salsuginis]SMG21357.1 hypothetical protein SAMN06275492_10747 [Dethiosulfovibrio salsuginis]
MGHIGRSGFSGILLTLMERAAPVLGALLLGLSIAALSSTVAYHLLTPVLGDLKLQKALNSSPAQFDTVDSEGEKTTQLRLFVGKNPFSVLIRPEVVEEKIELPPEDERVFSVDGIKVVGSLPGVAAWLSEQDKVSLVLLDQVYGGFVLKEISPYSVILSKGNVNYQVYISYRDQGKTASSKKSPKPVLEPILSDGPSMVQAASNESEGVVARELVDSLLMNPFDELKRVRLIAKFVDGKPVGIEVANIMDGSVLKELGVQKGDVVKSVNGVVIRNMGDVANAINSLMGGSRFEVSVGRGDQDVMLNYVVK